MTKEDFCYNCNFITFYPPDFFCPQDAECPGDFDPDNTYCPRHDGWLEELEDEEQEDD
ncbi:MAG: hypothetical protein QM279_06990 [Atribacterota bacterium]|nr:hypothetical protein [Atribacterota bacterium]